VAITHNNSAREGIDTLTTLSVGMVVSPASNIAAVIGVTWFSLLLETFIESVTFAGQTATFIQLVQNNAGVSEQYYVKGVAAGSRTLQVV